MKIISGKYKNRIIHTVKTANYRPTTSKLRAALFNILSSGKFLESPPVLNANLLDLFSGTGILSFEAVSRGAKSATLIDISPDCMKSAKKFAEKIGAKDNINCHVMDINLLMKSTQRYNLVFLDPPYYNDLCSKTLSNLIKHNWLDDKAIIVMEMEKSAKFEYDNFPNLLLVKEKIYGNNKLIFMMKE